MQILVNDDPLTLERPTTIAEVLEQLSHGYPGTALAVNQQIISRERWADFLLQEGDELVIFQAIAGG